MEVQVIEIKHNYLIVQAHWKKIYLSIFELKTEEKIILNQYLKITGSIKEIFFKNKIYEFAFDEYLANKNIHYQIEIKNVEFLTKGIFYQINKFYSNIFDHEFLKIFILGNHDSNFNLINSLNKLGLSYLLNFSGWTLFLGSWIFSKVLSFLKIKFKWKTRLKLSLDLGLLFFSATLNFPFVFTKTILFLLIKNIFWLKKIKINRYSLWAISFSILISFNQNLIRSTSFLYYLVGLVFLTSIPFNGWKKIILNLIISTFSFGLISSFLTYRFYYFNELFSLLFAPLIALLNIFIWFTWFIPNINLVYDFLSKLLILEANFLETFNFFYSFGYIPLYWYLLILSWFFLTTKKWTTNINSWWWILILVYCLSILFTYKFWFPLTGLHVLDVGNGSTTVYLNSKQVIVFDAGVGTGHSKQILSNFLRYLGIDHINYLFVSHAHQDHYNQIESLTSNAIQIDYLVHKENALESYHFNNFDLKVFNLNQKQINENNNSLVILLITKNFNVLLMGDLEKTGEIDLLDNESFRQAIILYQVDYLLIGHHGSNTSSTWDFLNFVQPKTALISGEKRGLNIFPNSEVISRLKEFKIPFLITSQDGDLWIK